ncbi:MAG: lipid-binding SYLF domain-containing protein [Burkholderiaceae bacterium]
MKMPRLQHLVIAAVALTATVPTLAADPAKERNELRAMCDQALATLYKEKPKLKTVVEKAPGYGCFSSFGLSFLIGGAGGRGVIYDRATKKYTYMNMAQASGGLDIGIKDYREVLVFRDASALNKFISSGWEFSGDMSATAAADGKGLNAQKGESINSPILVYPMTKTGLSLGVSAGARKYWKDADLN